MLQGILVMTLMSLKDIASNEYLLYQVHFYQNLSSHFIKALVGDLNAKKYFMLVISFFIASGMDGELELDKKILPSNFWNINILSQKEVFDTQKGIVRKITVKKLDNEEIEISYKKIKCKKFILNASSNPKDLGPFPEYTLWYHEKELLKMEFKNPKDKKIIKIIRNDWGK